MQVLRAALVSILLVACAHAPYTNVNAVRSEIKATIGDQRTIVSMGKTSNERAIVYTKTADDKRIEETWVREGGQWRMAESTVIAR